ncbi:peptidoglycan-binding domain-containing protein [Bosea sp. AS-1]|uniref:peptidoglycan-binding domain-containing protein n=1 Tax=Bosea sp. AS-1 TaxID=2015316 RepID=UPI0012FDAF49|nr:peptidoglycan-binding domain-containing protein [Bosea sp. AS-1]
MNEASVEAALRKLGYAPNGCPMRRMQVLKAFQTAHRLRVTGVADPKTIKALQAAMAAGQPAFRKEP